MSKYEQDILNTVNLHGRVSVMDLARILQVSDQTVRRIVKPMVEDGRLSKVHGALVSTRNVLDPPFMARMMQNRAAKVAIANAVAARIPDGAAVFEAYYDRAVVWPEESLARLQQERGRRA